MTLISWFLAKRVNSFINVTRYLLAVKRPNGTRIWDYFLHLTLIKQSLITSQNVLFRPIQFQNECLVHISSYCQLDSDTKCIHSSEWMFGKILWISISIDGQQMTHASSYPLILIFHRWQSVIRIKRLRDWPQSWWLKLICCLIEMILVLIIQHIERASPSKIALMNPILIFLTIPMTNSQQAYV